MEQENKEKHQNKEKENETYTCIQGLISNLSLLGPLWDIGSPLLGSIQSLIFHLHFLTASVTRYLSQGSVSYRHHIVKYNLIQYLSSSDIFISVNFL